MKMKIKRKMTRICGRTTATRKISAKRCAKESNRSTSRRRASERVGHSAAVRCLAQSRRWWSAGLQRARVPAHDGDVSNGGPGDGWMQNAEVPPPQARGFTGSGVAGCGIPRACGDGPNQDVRDIQAVSPAYAGID